jgi:hypothetical protein
MAYYVNNKEIVENVDINYILNFFKSKGETCIRIMYGRSFNNSIGNTLIIEPIKDKSKYVYQDGGRTILIDKERGSICINPYFDKSDHSLSKDLQEYILDYKQTMRDNKINNIIDEI